MIEVRPTALQTYHERYRLVYYHLANLIHNLTLTFSPRRTMVTTHTHAEKTKSQRSVGSKHTVETDGRSTDGRTRPTAVPSLTTWSVTSI